MRDHLLFLFLLAVCLGDSIFRREQLLSSPAVCLDGSPGVFYYSGGFGGGSNKLLISLEGGGWCGGSDLASTLENCYQRSLTDLGSSKKYPGTLNITEGVLSDDANLNPKFYNWNRVLVKYCDGSGYQGYKNTSISYKGARLFFRGKSIMADTLKLLEFLLKISTNISDIAVTGFQAGGLAAIQWGDQLLSTSNAKVWVIADSSIFLDTTNVKTGTYVFREQFINLMKVANVDADPAVPDGCLKQYPNEKWRCMFIQYLQPYLQNTWIFPVNSLYDTWSISNVLGITCIDSTGSLKDCSDSDRHVIDDYKENMTDLIVNIASGGAWAIACTGHGYINSNIMNSKRLTVPEGSNYTVVASIDAWVAGSEQIQQIDYVDWPDNKACAGTIINKGLTTM